MLARQDDTKPSTWNDRYRVRDACRAAERTYGLRSTSPADRTAPRYPTRAESEKAGRRGLDEAPWVTLRRAVNLAAASSATAEEFFARLQTAGITVLPRYSSKNPGQVTGYAVALDGDVNKAGSPVWYSGGKLAADLTWPKLALRWHPARQVTEINLTDDERAKLFEDAAKVAENATAHIRAFAATSPGAAADAAQAAADALHVAAARLHSRPLREAADFYERAAREPSGRIPRPTRAGNQLRQAARQYRRRFAVIIDGLDEAASLAEARAIVRHVVLGIAAVAGTRVVVGSRHGGGNGDLLDAFVGGVTQIDLDSPEFFEESDLAAYAEATLQLDGDGRPGNLYTDQAVASLVAAQIAAKSQGNFLVAGLIARAHGLHDEVLPGPAGLSFSAEVGAATREYLRRVPWVSPGVSAEEALTVLAFAAAPGLPASLWRVALRALATGDASEEALTRFARSPAAGFLIEAFSRGDQGATFCLSHQALSDALLQARARAADPAEDERALTREFLAAGQRTGWEDAPGYLLRSLPAHALRAGMTDDLLADSAYLVHADLRRVLPALDEVSSAAGHARARLLRLTPLGYPGWPR